MKRLFLLALVVGCAAGPIQRDIDKVFPFEAPFDVVWTAVTDVFGELSFPIDEIERDSGRLSTDWIPFDLGDGYADCGEPGASWADGKLMGRLDLVIQELEGSTRIIFDTVFQLERGVGGAATAHSCRSRGALERKITDAVAERIGHGL